MLRRLAFGIVVLALVACATSRNRSNAQPTSVRVTTWPEQTAVVVDCGANRFNGTAPLDFEFPAGPNARCAADFAADHYQKLHVNIDREYLFEHGELTKRRDLPSAVRVAPARGPVNAWEALILAIEVGIQHAIDAVHRAAVANQPDITLRVSLQPEPAS